MSGSRQLAGHGVELVRERALAARVQGALERMYQLDRVADVQDFLRGADEGEREALLVHEAGDGALEMTLRLPQLRRREARAAPAAPTSCASGARSAERTADGDLDACCQIIEGVSHFVYVVERARLERRTTQLELEIQAEVDKWLVLAASIRPFDVGRSADLRARLYEQVSFRDDGSSEAGERYRVANDVAHRFVRRLERHYLSGARYDEMRTELRNFFRVGQEEKLRLGRAA
jgi:hypothetical protein